MAIYMTLGKATVGLEPKSEMDALQFEMGRGMTRLDPFVDKAAGAIGQDKFYHDAVASRIWEDRILGFPMPNAARSNIAHRVAADAEQCDHQLDEWGAPHMCFAPTANWHVCLGSEPGQHR